MLTDKQILDNLSLTIIEKDQQGNIIRPTDKKELDKCLELLDNIVEIDNDFFDRKNDKWYQIRNVELFDDSDKTMHKVTYIIDITYHKIKERKAFIDEVTRLYNRNLTNRLVNDYISLAKIKNESFSIMICDLDEFKSANDSYGHLCGDMVLEKVGKVLLSEADTEIGDSDIVGRLGGDEFFVLFKNIDLNSTINKAESLKSKVENLDIIYDGQKIKSPTMSIGIYHVSRDELLEICDVDAFRLNIYKKADRALYYSKNIGKNKVTDYDSIALDTYKVMKKNRIW